MLVSIRESCRLVHLERSLTSGVLFFRVISCQDFKNPSTPGHSDRNKVCEIHISQNETPESFGLLLYTFRNRLGITQRDAASRTAISRAYYSALENSKRPPPPAKRVVQLGRALGASSREQVVLQAVAKAERLTHKALPTERHDVHELVQHLLVHGPSLTPSQVADLLRQASKQPHLDQSADSQSTLSVCTNNEVKDSASVPKDAAPKSTVLPDGSDNEIS